MRATGIAGMLIALGLAGAASASNELELLQTVTLPCGGIESMEGPTDAVLSPDEQHLYVVSSVGTSGQFDALTVFDHDPVTAALTFKQSYTTSDPGLAIALFRPNGITVSPDGTSVYVVSATGRHIAAFARTPATGALTFVNLVDDLDPGVDGLDGASGVVVSPDGAHVYVAAFNDDAISIFDRDGGTSALTFAGLVQQGVGGVMQLEGPTTLAMSADGTYLYVAARGRAPSFAGQLNVFERNPATGALTLVETSGLAGPKNVLISPDGAHVYASRFDGVDVFDRDAGTGMLTLVESQPVGGLAEGFVLGSDPTGSHLYYKEGDTIEVLARDAGSGELTPVGVAAQASGTLDGLDDIRAFVFPASGDFVHVVAHADSSITTFARDGGTGGLTPVGMQLDAGPPHAVAVTPDGKHAYVVCARATGVLARDVVTGALTPSALVEHSSIPGDVLASGNFAGRQARVTVSPDGAHVYELRPGAAVDSLEAFARDPVTGALTSIQTLDDTSLGLFAALDVSNGVAVSPDGAHAYVSADSTSETVVVFDRDPGTGLLTLVETDAPATPTAGRGVVVSPDGAHVYALGRHSPELGRIAAFDRDPVTGQLTPGPILDDFTALDELGGLAISGDGASVYAGGDVGAAVVVLARDAATGALAVVDEIDEPEGLANLRRIVVDPADTSVFTVGRSADGSTSVLNAFRRDATSGVLTFTDASAPGSLPFDLTASADGQNLYLVDFADETVSVFARTTACSATPLGACAIATGARLTIKDQGVDARRLVSWKWKSTDEPMLGDPLTTSRQALCLYDASVAPQPLVDAAAPAGGTCRGKPCWRPIGTGFKYADGARTPDGLQRLKIVAKPGKRSKVVVKAKGGAMSPFGLPFTMPVVVQLQSSDAGCVEATFTAAKLNAGGKLTATAP